MNNEEIVPLIPSGSFGCQLTVFDSALGFIILNPWLFFITGFVSILMAGFVVKEKLAKKIFYFLAFLLFIPVLARFFRLFYEALFYKDWSDFLRNLFDPISKGKIGYFGKSTCL